MSSVQTIPLLFLNLGGEMMYILDQRLNAQRIPRDKALKVMNDIVGIMLNERFLRELFKPQEVYNKQALRKLFEDLAHASIMRLNKASMDKLYDLMTMTFKYQLFMAARPLDLILITLNHLDAIRDFVSAPAIQKQIDATYMMVMEVYAHLSFGELQTIRYSLLNFFQDLKVRVSVFLRQGVQTDDGKFVIPTSGPVAPGCEVPGLIRVFDSNGDVRQVRHFPSGGNFTAANEPGSMERLGDRVIELGRNIYKWTPASGRTSPDLPKYTPDGTHNTDAPVACYENVAEMTVGREELNLLMTQLLGNQASHDKKLIHLNLFNVEQDEGELSHHQGLSNTTINIDARNQPRSAALEMIYDEMTIVEPVEEEEGPQDILDMLDNLK